MPRKRILQKSWGGVRWGWGGGGSVEQPTSETSGEFNLCARLASHVCVEFDSNSVNGAESQSGVVSQVV